MPYCVLNHTIYHLEDKKQCGMILAYMLPAAEYLRGVNPFAILSEAGVIIHWSHRLSSVPLVFSYRLWDWLFPSYLSGLLLISLWVCSHNCARVVIVNWIENCYVWGKHDSKHQETISILCFIFRRKWSVSWHVILILPTKAFEVLLIFDLIVFFMCSSLNRISVWPSSQRATVPFLQSAQLKSHESEERRRGRASPFSGSSLR